MMIRDKNPGGDSLWIESKFFSRSGGKSMMIREKNPGEINHGSNQNFSVDQEKNP